MSSRRFGDPSNTRKPNKFGMVPAWWADKLRSVPTGARAVAVVLCLDLDNDTGITRKSRTMTEWATECGLDRGTLRAGLIELTLAGMITPERNITPTGKKGPRTAFRIQILFANPDDKQPHPTSGAARTTSSNRNGGTQDQPQRPRLTTRPRSQTLDCASEGRFEKSSALNADKARIERRGNPQSPALDNGEKSRNGSEPDWLKEPGVSGPTSYEPGADAEVLGAP